MAQKIGTMGESYFNYLCASENVNCNKSEEDMAGWDYILDFPLVHNSPSSDTASGPIECKVQIKSTTKDRRYSQVKLSNLLRFVKTPLPAFFVFFEFDGKKEPQRMFLLHFDNEHIANALSKIRKAEQGIKKKKIHTSSMTINYDDSHMVSPLNGFSLIEKIKSFIPEGIAEYSKKKLEYVESVGFESGSGVLRFTTTEHNALDKMIEAMLGVDNEIKVSDIVITQSRFGIELAQPLSKLEKGVIKLEQTLNFLNVLVRFREEKYSAPIEFHAKAFIPPIPNLPIDKARMRIKTAFFDLMIGMGGKISTYQLTMDNEKYPVDELLKQAKLMQWMCFEKRSLLFDIELENKPESRLEFSITPSESDVHSGGDEWIEEIENLERVIWILDKHKIKSGMRLSINETYKSRKEIFNFYNIYNLKLEDVIFKYSVDGAGYEVDESKKHSTTYAFHLWLGGVLVVTIITLIGVPSKTSDNYYTLSLEEKVIEKELVCYEYDGEFKEHFKSIMEQINHRYSNDGYVVINNK
ncbi:hypothetical protein [Pantoea ananatis]|uniref:hypothetical protein n=1 Tax=Pantoea ananas TaxID=553 RepID=UPI001B3054F2|nr:hypothetical protein [Pantoea ananatis]